MREGETGVRQLIETRLQHHRTELARVQACVEQQMVLTAKQRNGSALRFLHGRVCLHELVIEELESLLDRARESFK
jgi:hypothetical protein